MTLTEKQYERLLHWCNGVRAKLGASTVDRLRKGAPGEAAHCPLANTINYRVAAHRRVQVDETDVYRGEDPLEPDEVVAKTPMYAESMIRDFDRGNHPELIGRGWA